MNFRKIFLITLVFVMSMSLMLTGCGGQDQSSGNDTTLKLGVNVEFLERADGLPALEETYGFKFDRDNIVTMKTGLTYDALRNGKIDIAMGFATDGRIPAFNLVNLKDDKKFFPVYNPAPTIRKEVLETYPNLAEVINQLPPLLDQKTLANLNKQVDVDGKEPEDVAEAFLREQGLLKETADKKEGPAIRVSCKPWTEQLILGNMLIDLLESNGYRVEDRTGLGETPVLRKALTSDQIDIYWEYTGTVLMTVMKEDQITQAEEAYKKVKEWDAKENNIIWLDYAPANNTYTLMMTKERAEELGIESISDLADYINEK